MTNITLEQFSGPFSVLTSLIEDEKLSISELSLSKITEQYLAYLETLEEEKADELSDFLVVASRLLLLKARLLLPQLQPIEEEGPSLADQLRLYKMFVKASRHIDTLWEADKFAYGRVEPIQKVAGFVITENVNTESLFSSLQRLLKKIRPAKPLPEVRVDKAVSMKETIERFKTILKKLNALTFDDFVQEKENKTEVVVSFLALLELVKQKVVLLQQEQSFGTINIQKI